MSEHAGERRPEVVGARPDDRGVPEGETPAPQDPTPELPVREAPAFQMMGDQAGVCIDGVCLVPDQNGVASPN